MAGKDARQPGSQAARQPRQNYAARWFRDDVHIHPRFRVCTGRRCPTDASDKSHPRLKHIGRVTTGGLPCKGIVFVVRTDFLDLPVTEYHDARSHTPRDLTSALRRTKQRPGCLLHVGIGQL